MYESPIQLIQEELEIHAEGEILKAVQRVGVNVDKEELLRVLAHDRGQYDKGYHDGVNDVCNRIVEQLELLQDMYGQREEDAREHGLTIHADLEGVKAYVIGEAIEIVKEELGE